MNQSCEGASTADRPNTNLDLGLDLDLDVGAHQKLHESATEVAGVVVLFL